MTVSVMERDGFSLKRPEGRSEAVLVEVPHAGTELPAEVRATLLVDDAQLARDADGFVDVLFDGVDALGATVLVARLSRYAVDLNRDEGSVDSRTVEGAADGEFPRGVIWRETGDGRPALRGRLSMEEYRRRIDRWWRPYHETLATELEALRGSHGSVLLLSAHSMPSRDRPTTDRAVGARRADVVPGTRDRTTAHPALIDAVEQHFRGHGLSVRHDVPYRGGATTARWGCARVGVHAIQVEINRGVYMDEVTGELYEERARWLAGVCEGLVKRLIGEMERVGGR